MHTAPAPSWIYGTPGRVAAPSSPFVMAPKGKKKQRAFWSEVTIDGETHGRWTFVPVKKSALQSLRKKLKL